MSNTAVSPRDKFLTTALALFAARGFYGVSLADVARELGLTKQSILHHFKSKEALYGAVLAGLANRLNTVFEGSAPDPLTTFLHRLFAHLQTHPADARLILRELLDNIDRAPQSQNWYLKDFLDKSDALLVQTGAANTATAEAHAVRMYQLIGAVHYFAISTPTLTAMRGAEFVQGMADAFMSTLLNQVAHVSDGSGQQKTTKGADFRHSQLDGAGDAP
ncbi:MAG: TetR/AcrR family transcriptional regulator [Pseudomonadota bacterium]